MHYFVLINQLKMDVNGRFSAALVSLTLTVYLVGWDLNMSLLAVKPPLLVSLHYPVLLLELVCCEWLVCSLSDCGGSVGTEGER